jgi:hypothetical protein
VEGDPSSDWLFEAWHWLLEGPVATPRAAPKWFEYPAMMRMTVSTPAVLGILKRFTRPSNFVLVPLLFQRSYFQRTNASKLSLIMPLSKHRDEWLNTMATDTQEGKKYPICLLDPTGRTKKIEVKCYGNILGEYRNHPEAKFLGPDGIPCHGQTRGVLTRTELVTGRIRYIGKETLRRWEQGEDLSMVDFKCSEYTLPIQKCGIKSPRSEFARSHARAM